MKTKFTCIVVAAMLFSLCVNAQTSWQITGNSNITNNNFIGTTNQTAFKIRTNNAVRMTINNAGSVGIGPEWSKYDSHWRKYAAKHLQRSVLVPYNNVIIIQGTSTPTH